MLPEHSPEEVARAIENSEGHRVEYVHVDYVNQAFVPWKRRLQLFLFILYSLFLNLNDNFLLDLLADYDAVIAGRLIGGLH